jgi:DNA helicase HerA-like ATPase
LAHQHLGQLPKALREDVLANARSRVIFQTAASDAQRLAREVAPYLTAADLQGLGPYEVAVTLSVGGRISPPVTGRTLLPSPGTGTAEAAREYSRRHYGKPRDEVEAAIRARHSGQAGSGPVGRREVRS